MCGFYYITFIEYMLEEWLYENDEIVHKYFENEHEKLRLKKKSKF